MVSLSNTAISDESVGQTRLCRSIESSHPGSHVWFALILTGLNSFMIANVYTAGSVFIWSMT